MFPDNDTIIWLNWAGAIFAAAANGVAAARFLGRKSWLVGGFFAFTAVYALVYVSAYIALLSGVDQSLWTKVMRVVSIPVWLIVWSWFAVFSERIRQQARLRAVKELDELVDKKRNE